RTEAEQIVYEFATSPLTPVYEQAGRELSRHMRKRPAAGDATPTRNFEASKDVGRRSNSMQDMAGRALDRYQAADASDRKYRAAAEHVRDMTGRVLSPKSDYADPYGTVTISRRKGFPAEFSYFEADGMRSADTYGEPIGEIVLGGRITDPLASERSVLAHELVHASDPEILAEPRHRDEGPKRTHFLEQRADEGALIGEIADDWLRSDQSEHPVEFARRWIQQNAGNNDRNSVHRWRQGLTHTPVEVAAERVAQLAATVAMRRTNRPRFQRRAHPDELRMPKDDVRGDPAWEMSLSAESVVRHFSLQ
ncbi:MAG: hypothetical protein VKL39_24415, partial [Leptolyngbyaceae bacterium]|nr:hypothetical protein [Leptolyngbyaceae bacterium]